MCDVLFFEADPFLVATEEAAFVEGATKDEFACFGIEPHFGVVSFAIVGVEDGAALEFAIAPFHVVDDDHAYDWFVVERAFAFGAEFVFFAFDENAFDLAIIFSIGATVDVDD